MRRRRARAAASSRRVDARARVLPAGEQALEGAEQEVARAAGRVDQLAASGRPNSSIAGVERAVEDERLDEVRRLQQRVGFLRRLGEVLVEVAEEAGVARRVGEVVDGGGRRRSRRRARSQSSIDRAGAVADDRQPPERVVALVEQRRGGGDVAASRKTSCRTSRSVSSRVLSAKCARRRVRASSRRAPGPESQRRRRARCPP